MNRGAEFSPCGLYRYLLWRTWDSTRPQLCFVMLNPSTADAEKNDPTVHRCQTRAESMGFGGLQVLNVFAFRATDPKVMKAAADPIGRNNDGYLIRAANSAKAGAAQIVAGWGHHAQHWRRDKNVLLLFKAAGVDLYCLGTTKDGHPRHPLYVGYDVKPTIYRSAK
jgi:hypothetical protein